ncbi:hypothetical protein M2132_001812 [Dysgonomonas sp. PH5-45]|uniref:hypothetical protein n=1 Tax=unclassified Dysgonomonas TaxID=2630389 RepID=UPI00247485C7|nr:MULTISPECIES: hypothetical protein [unclassified Dysgonomonas]MDH6355469.1 hypothetical protein [Dysgonomonas sp. PH5-45]MDH6388365.1 hypothetical protein [Dysgonomonas sp. PH5-37]
MENFWEENISLNSFQISAMTFRAKIKSLIAGRGTGKSFITGAEIDENVRTMPRGITGVVQQTLGQALTKTLPSAFKYMEKAGYQKYNPKTKIGDYVICQKPPEHFYTPHEKIMSYEHMITFSNGHSLYLLSQIAGARGPNIDYTLSDEALTLDKVKFDQEAVPTNRGNEEQFGIHSPEPLFKHHGSTFTSSMGYLPEHKWLTDFAAYYEEEAGIQLFVVWNKIVNMQLQLIQAKMNNDEKTAVELWKECGRLRKTITPFVSKDGVLFMLSNAFDNIYNLGFSYLTRMYKVMDLVSFMIEILNFYINKVTDCYYALDDRHIYYKADNDDYIRGLAENNNFDWEELAKGRDCLWDADCDPNKPLEITPDWGTKISLIEVAQECTFDFVSGVITLCDNNINEFFVKPDENTDTMINALIDNFCLYYSKHKTKVVYYTVDTYGDIRLANSKKTYNQHAIDRLKRHKWNVRVRKHPGKEPPQNDKYLLWGYMLHETEPRLPKKRFNGARCKYTLISMNNTSVIQKNNGFFEKDKRSEKKTSVLPEEATHFGDAVDKRIWTKYGTILKKGSGFVNPRI